MYLFQLGAIYLIVQRDVFKNWPCLLRGHPFSMYASMGGRVGLANEYVLEASLK